MAVQYFKGAERFDSKIINNIFFFFIIFFSLISLKVLERHFISYKYSHCLKESAIKTKKKQKGTNTVKISKVTVNTSFLLLGEVLDLFGSFSFSLGQELLVFVDGDSSLFLLVLFEALEVGAKNVIPEGEEWLGKVSL